MGCGGGLSQNVGTRGGLQGQPRGGDSTAATGGGGWGVQRPCAQSHSPNLPHPTVGQPHNPRAPPRPQIPPQPHPLPQQQPPPTPAPPVTALNSLLSQQRTLPTAPAPSGPGPRPPRPLQERPPAPVTSQRPPPPQRPPLTRRPPPAPRPSCPRTAPAPSRVQRSPIGCGAKERTPIGCGGHQSARPRPAWGAAEWSPPETRSATEGSGQRTEQRCPRGGADGAQQRTAQSGARQPLPQEG